MSKQAVVTVTGTSWDEERFAVVDDAHAVARAVFTTEYAGDIVGTSTCGLLISYIAGEPEKMETWEGPYLGYEQVTGTLEGRTGTFVLSAKGAHTGAVARTEVEVVEGSATGDLVGLRGTGSYAADGMTYTLTLDYEL